MKFQSSLTNIERDRSTKNAFMQR